MPETKQRREMKEIWGAEEMDGSLHELLVTHTWGPDFGSSTPT